MPDTFAHESSKKLFEEFRQTKPTEPRFEAFARMLADTPAGPARQQVYEDFMHRETRDETEVLHAVEVAQQVEAAERAAGPVAPEPSRAEAERAEHERQRQAILDAGAQPAMSTNGSGGYSVDDRSVDALTDSAQRVWELALNKGVAEPEAFRLAKKWENQSETLVANASEPLRSGDEA